MCTKIVIAREREEDIARQQSPITTEMFVELQKHASRLHIDSLESSIFDLFCLIRVTGFQVAEFAQKTQTDVDEHEYPSGKQVIMAFLPKLEILHQKGKLITTHTLEGNVRMPSQKVKIIFIIKKNRKNGQSITINADDEHPEICPVRATQRIFF
jgi:hypothetical protein